MAIINGTSDSHRLTGTAGDDILVSAGGSDTLDGGAGFDAADFGALAGDLSVNLAEGTERGVTNSFFVSIEAAAGGSGDDALTGDANANRLDGRGGDDVLSGGAGNDTLIGGAGDDVIDGGAGFDTADMGAVGFRGAMPSASAGGTVFTAAAAGTDLLTGVEVAAFADGRLVMDPSDPAAQVARLYEAALDRLPDQGGLNFWIGQEQHGQPLSVLAAGFANSREFIARFGDAATDHGAYVDRLYLNVLGRGGEAEGRQFWVNSLDHGASRADVLVAFSESAENKAGTAELVQGGIWDRSEAAAEVARLYDTVLGRLPEVSGLLFWKDAMEAGNVGLGEVARGFAASREFQDTYGATTNGQFVDTLYHNALDRAPEQTGHDFWTAKLAGGMARLDVVLAFSESAEHVALTASQIQSETPGEFGILFA